MASEISEFFMINARARPEFNLIERLFSKLRFLFQVRSVVDFTKELRQFDRLIRLCDEKKDFKVYLRATIRTVHKAG